MSGLGWCLLRRRKTIGDMNKETGAKTLGRKGVGTDTSGARATGRKTPGGAKEDLGKKEERELEMEKRLRSQKPITIR